MILIIINIILHNLDFKLIMVYKITLSFFRLIFKLINKVKLSRVGILFSSALHKNELGPFIMQEILFYIYNFCIIYQPQLNDCIWINTNHFIKIRNSFVGVLLSIWLWLLLFLCWNLEEVYLVPLWNCYFGWVMLKFPWVCASFALLKINEKR